MVLSLFICLVNLDLGKLSPGNLHQNDFPSFKTVGKFPLEHFPQKIPIPYISHPGQFPPISITPQTNCGYCPGKFSGNPENYFFVMFYIHNSSQVLCT